MLVYGTSGSGKSTLLRTLAIAAGTAPRLGGGAGVRARLRLRRAPIARVAAARRLDHPGRRRRAGAAPAALARRRARRPRQGVQRGECREPHRVPPAHRPPTSRASSCCSTASAVQGGVGGDDGADAVLQRLHADPRRGPPARRARRRHRGSRRRGSDGGERQRLEARSCCGWPTRIRLRRCSACRRTCSTSAPRPGARIVDGFETQIAVLGGTPNVAEQSKALSELGEQAPRRRRRGGAGIGALPTSYVAAALPDACGGPSRARPRRRHARAARVRPRRHVRGHRAAAEREDERDEGAHRVGAPLRPRRAALPLRGSPCRPRRRRAVDAQRHDGGVGEGPREGARRRRGRRRGARRAS